jgi:hypothetical protein
VRFGQYTERLQLHMRTAAHIATNVAGDMSEEGECVHAVRCCVCVLLMLGAANAEENTRLFDHGYYGDAAVITLQA